MPDTPESDIKILVACHKADPAIRHDNIYMPIQVGKALHQELDLGFQTDDTGDNISVKNGSYCELTALYWAWKNLPEVDYIGLCHYRRYFDMPDIARIGQNNCLAKGGFIILRQKRLFTNVVTELASLTSWEDTYIFINELLKRYPDRKKLIFDYFYRSNKFTICNMFITSWSNFDAYCKFMFDLLGDVENRILPSGYSRMRRVIGYLSETLLGFWLALNDLPYEEVDMDSPTEVRSPNMIKRWLNDVRTDWAFRLRYATLRKPQPCFFEDWVQVGLRQDGKWTSAAE